MTAASNNCGRQAKHSFSGFERQSEEDLFLLLDGFDEMQSVIGRQSLIHWLVGNDADSPKRFWITSRPSAMPEYIPGLRRVRLDSFGSNQIDRFVEKFPWTSPERGAALSATLRDAPELADLAKMPLLLTLLALLSDVEQEALLPRRREGIYDRILNLFMGDWDRAKGIKRTYSVPDQGDRLIILG